MGITFKRVLRRNPINKEAAPRFYPAVDRTDRPVNLEDMVVDIKEKSSLTEGDIRSVIVNFVEVMRKYLYNGRVINVKNFGIFYASIRAIGAEKREDCKVSNITGVRIRFRPSSAVRPDMNATEPGQRIEFFDKEKYDEKKIAAGGGDGGNTGGNTGGDDDDDDGGYMG
jgi:predicted histone-like DNA-binding protein